VSGDELVVPEVVRDAMFVPRQAPGHRQPARVTAGAFRAAGLPVPEHPEGLNVYRLTGRRGLPWSPGIDAHVRRRGAELLGHGGLVLVDVDIPAAVDGTPLVDSLRWLSDRAVEAGEIPDLSATLAVRTPGHPRSGHLPGWHLWYRPDPRRPVRMGPLVSRRTVELRDRGTCPGSPGYEVWHAPRELPVLPAWIAALAGPPRPRPAPVPASTATAGVWRRLHGLISRVLAERDQGERNKVLFWASARAGELVAAGGLDPGAAEMALLAAAAEIGLVREDGERRVAGTIRSGLHAGGAA